MARTGFGGTLASWLVTSQPSTEEEGGPAPVVIPDQDTTLQLYDGPAGGNLLNDFELINGDGSTTAVSAIVIAAGSPYIPSFRGPDGVDQVWVQAASGEWLPLPHAGSDNVLTQASLGTSVFSLNSENDVEVPADRRVATFRIAGDGPDHKFRFVYNDLQTGGFNQYGEVRSFASSDARTALRCAGRSQSQSEAIFQALLERTVGPVLFEVTPSVTRSSLPIEAPNVHTGIVSLADGVPVPTGLPAGTILVRYNATGGGGAAPRPITYVGGAPAGNQNASQIIATWPTDIAARDVALLWWTTNTGSGQPAPPNGFQLAAEHIGNTGSQQSCLYVRTLDGTESGDIVLTSGASNRQCAALVVYRGVQPTGPIDQWAALDQTTTSLTHSCPPVTIGHDGGAVLTTYAERVGNGSTDATAPSGYTRRVHTDGLATGNGGTYLAVADDGLAGLTAGTAVTPGDWTGQVATDNVITWSIALRAAVDASEYDITTVTVLA